MLKLITTSVVQDSEQGESHGGVFVIDPEVQEVRQVLDFETTAQPRQGGDWGRGLRGIAIDGDTIYLVASDTLFAFAPDFSLVGSWHNQYLDGVPSLAV